MSQKHTVCLDSVYNSLQGKGMSTESIRSILTLAAAKLDPPPPEAELNLYFQSKGL